MKRLQDPALLTRGGDLVPVPASPVCPSPVAFCCGSTSQPRSQPWTDTLGAGVPARGGGGHWSSWSGCRAPQTHLLFVGKCTFECRGEERTAGVGPVGLLTFPPEEEISQVRRWIVPIVWELWVQPCPHGLGCDSDGGGHCKISGPVGIGTAGCRDPPPSKSQPTCSHLPHKKPRRGFPAHLSPTRCQPAGTHRGSPYQPNLHYLNLA